MMNTQQTKICMRASSVVAFVLICVTSIGCSKARKPVNEKPVVPVTGILHVDGAPLAGVTVELHPKNPEETHRVFPKASTDEEGRFTPWTYRKGDGLAAGEYTLTFLDHSQSTPQTRKSDRRDLFRGKYENPKRSKHTVVVPDTGESVDIGTIELSH